jgi:hypothetical protein
MTGRAPILAETSERNITMNRRVRLALAALAFTTAAVLTPAVLAGVTAAPSDSAWGAPAPGDSAWGSTPAGATDQPATTMKDSAWG